MNIDKESSGSGVEMTCGILYDLLENLSLGFTMRSGCSIKLNGEIEQKTAGISAITGGKMPDVNQKTDYTQEYAYPMTYGFGASYSPSGKIILGSGIEFNDYSVIKTDVDYKDETVYTDVDENSDWENTVQLRGGIEYLMDNNWKIRAGIQNDPAPTPNKKLTQLNTNQYSLTVLNVGLGYSSGKWKMDIAYIPAISDKPKKKSRKYEYESRVVQVGVSYDF